MQKLFHNATFVTMENEDSVAEALLVDEDGTIAYIGNLEDARAQAQDAQEIDLGGKVVLPGFIDPHSHFCGVSRYVLFADLSQCTSFDDICNKLREFAEENNVDEDGIICGQGYDQNFLEEGCHPTKDVLDTVSTTIPVSILHCSGHMAVINSRYLELAGIGEGAVAPEGGLYGYYEGTKTPNGYVEELAALLPLNPITLSRQKFDIVSLCMDMQKEYLSHGITTCQEGATTMADEKLYTMLASKGLLKLDVVSYPMIGEDIDTFYSEFSEFVGPEYNNHWRIGGVKMFADGSPQGLTAWMSEPYVEGPHGETDYVAYGTISDEDAVAFIKEAIDKDRQVLCHTNGDAASDQYMRCYEKAMELSDNPNKANLRPVMIHCQTARRDQYENMKRIGMIPSIYASHIWYWGDIHVKNFGPVRGGRISACHDAIECGLPFTLHTDTPILRPNMLEAVWCAAARITRSGAQLDEDQRVSVFEALRAITANAAYQYGEEDRKGTLAVGKLADLVVLDKNPLDVALDEIKNIEVLETIKEGAVVYSQR